MRQLTLIYSDLPRPTRVDSGVKNNFSWFLSIFYIIPQNVLWIQPKVAVKNIHTQALNRFVQHNEPKLLSLALYTLLTIMADSPSTSSDFTSAKLRKKRKHKNIKLPSSTSHSLARLRDKIREEEWFIQCSSWCQNVNKDYRSLTVNRLLDLLKSSWDCFSTETPVILCLGLGSPSSSHIARVQLAFLTEACQQLKVVCVYSFTAAQMYSFFFFLNRNMKTFLSMILFLHRKTIHFSTSSRWKC